MSLSVTISTYQHSDFMPLIGLLMEALPHEAMSPELFARKVLLDPNFDPNGAFVARGPNGLVGFLLAITRKRPLEDGPIGYGTRLDYPVGGYARRAETRNRNRASPCGGNMAAATGANRSLGFALRPELLDSRRG